MFLTLSYLAVQVGHARREMQRSISQSRSEGIRDMFMARLANERLKIQMRKVGAYLFGYAGPRKNEFTPAARSGEVVVSGAYTAR